MEVRYSPDLNGFKKMDTNELRNSFLIDTLFKKDRVEMVYSDIDRSITGSAVPVKKVLKLIATKKEMAADYFTERREIGVINIGAKGMVNLDGKNVVMESFDALYIGRGVKKVEFKSTSSKNPSKFYFVSYPAHKEYPSKLVKFAEATPVKLGSLKDSNSRTIYKYIHPGTMETCQLVMGLTMLDEGSVWNTMPPHTHQRRSEVYMYFGLDENSIVLHLLGSNEETRHIIIRNEEAVLSTSWSMHSGCGTKNYSFIWAMGGENQVFDDMDWILMRDLK
ncbi:MAG TPA: 5-dehydro-4-deoxy-D-glucuronate isomerase [Ignavibacteriaceae bacterium]|nr:5-dehydro-4-deoxy-D-glucuronate isomerase [Ignavibacteriaceae bacterium]